LRNLKEKSQERSKSRDSKIVKRTKHSKNPPEVVELHINLGDTLTSSNHIVTSKRSSVFKP